MFQDVICLSCPNGCHLSIHAPYASGEVEVAGNRCDRGLAFARRVIRGDRQKSHARMVSVEAPPAYSDESLRQLLAAWGVDFHAAHPRMIPPGSPERTAYRMVVEDKSQTPYVLEKIHPWSYHHKMKIIRTLEFLAGRGLARITPYLKTTDGEPIQHIGYDAWQLVPFTSGVALDRATYLYEGWRAEVLAGFLLELRSRSEGMTFLDNEETFSLKDYVHTLLQQIRRRRPALLPQLDAVLAVLEQRLWPVYDTLPTGFCHGDFHPLNIIWGREDVRGVIDWEFLGRKPELYDAANMVGCLGIEHPSSLERDLVRGFVSRLRGAGRYAQASWRTFPELVLALRFAWLSEWLRKADEEMVGMELEYMSLLIENREALAGVWGLGTE